MSGTTDERITRLEDALAGGVLEITFESGERIRYRSLDEIRQALAYFREKRAAERGRGSVNVSVGGFFRG